MDKSKVDKLGKEQRAADREKRLESLQNLRERLETGAPAENVSGAEAAVAYRAVTRTLSPEQVEEATADALGKLPEGDRQQISALIRQQGGSQFTDLDDDPKHLAQASTQLGATQSGGLDGLLSSLLGGAQGSSAGGGGISDLLENPLVKTVLAGVATSAMSKFAGGSGQGGGLDDMLGGLLGGKDTSAGATESGGLGGMLGGLLGGGQGGKGGGGLDDLLGGLLGGGQGSQGGGGLDDLLSGLLGGGSQEEQPKPSPSRRNEM